jgi:putative FmdB family regulatory protein
MPIYEYICLDCKQRFEALRPMKDADEPIACADCQGEHTSRLLSVFFATSGGKTVTAGTSGCSSCASKTCSTCGVH